MRSIPKDVPPVVHNGVRYEAPHFWDSNAVVGATAMAALSESLEAALRKSLQEGPEPKLQDPEWLKGALAGCSASAAEKEAFLDLMAFQAVVAPVMQKVTIDLMSHGAMDREGLPAMDRDAFRRALEKEGTLSAEQIERAISQFSAHDQASPAAPYHQNGGMLVVFDCATGRQLWQTCVFKTDYDPALEQDVQDVFITGLRLDGESLVVDDEAGRAWRVDLSTRQVV